MHGDERQAGAVKEGRGGGRRGEERRVQEPGYRSARGAEKQKKKAKYL